MKYLRALAILTLLALPALVWFEPTGVVQAWLSGEPFYRGRPASYWRAEMLHGDVFAGLTT